jgi:uncharacterized phage-like protein YoqJ
MIVAITGHRPERLTHPFLDYIPVLKSAFEDLGATYVIQGMAAGIDILAGYAAHEAKIPFMAAVPYSGHDKFNKRAPWPRSYTDMMLRADKVVILVQSDAYPGPWVFHKRNQYMVDHADAVLSVYDGSPKGGTKSCIDYALKKHGRVYNIHPDTFQRTVIH